MKYLTTIVFLAFLASGCSTKKKDVSKTLECRYIAVDLMDQVGWSEKSKNDDGLIWDTATEIKKIRDKEYALNRRVIFEMGNEYQLALFDWDMRCKNVGSDAALAEYEAYSKFAEYITIVECGEDIIPYIIDRKYSGHRRMTHQLQYAIAEILDWPVDELRDQYKSKWFIEIELIERAGWEEGIPYKIGNTEFNRPPTPPAKR